MGGGEGGSKLLSAVFLPTQRPFGGVLLPACSIDSCEVEQACLAVFWDSWARRK